MSLLAPTLSSRQLAARWEMTQRDTRALLSEEAERGHVERIGDRWQATPEFVAEYAAAFRQLAIVLDATEGSNADEWNLVASRRAAA